MPGRITELAALATPATDDLIEVVDVSDTSMAASGTNKKASVGAFSGAPASVRTAVGRWHASPYAQGVQGSDVWVIQSRMYFTPFFVETARSISDLSVHVTGAGGAGVVARFAVYSADAASSLPATVLHQTTIAADTVGAKTVSGLSVAVGPGLFWIGSASQGSGQVAQCWAYGQTFNALPMSTNSPAADNNAMARWVWYVDGISGTAPDNPSVTMDGAMRMPAIVVKYA